MAHEHEREAKETSDVTSGDVYYNIPRTKSEASHHEDSKSS